MLRRLAYTLLGLALLSTAAFGVGVIVDLNGLMYSLTATPSPNSKVPLVSVVDVNGAPIGGTGAAAQNVQGPEANGATAAANPFVAAIINGAGAIAREISISSSTNVNGTGVQATGIAAACDDASQTLITENSFGAVAMDCVTHALKVAIQPLPAGGAVGLNASSGNVANAAATATLAANATKTTYITGFSCQAAGATAGLAVNMTVTGLLGGTETYTYTFPAGVAVPGPQLVREFSAPRAGSAINTAIVVSLPAGGAGNTNASCSAEGFQL